MARGGRRVGAGRKMLPLSHHTLHGTFRKDRHGHLLAAAPDTFEQFQRHRGGQTATAPAVPAPVPPIPDDVLVGLGPKGAAFVARVWQHYGEWTAVAEVLLHEAGTLVDQLETLRGTTGERPAQRMLVTIIAALGLKESP